MKKETISFCLLSLLFTLLMSLPFLAPGTGWVALVGFVPLLCMDYIAGKKRKHFWWWHYLCFLLWNAVTTWWVANATVGGAIFAIVANALQMSLVFGLFRFGKRRMGGVLPYLLLAAAWIAWEKYYLSIAQISWPWLVLGNAFANTTGLVQWYEVTGHLGGSLWVWASNLAIFGLMVSILEGRFKLWNSKAKAAAIAGTLLGVFGPMIWSVCIPEKPASDNTVKVVTIQPNFDPYEKHESLSRWEQDARFMELLEGAEGFLADSLPCLVVGPETFTDRFILEDYDNNSTFNLFQDWLREHPQCDLLFGASAYNRSYSLSRPNLLAYDMGETVVEGHTTHMWYTSHNTSVITDTSRRCDIFHKGKLVPGTELTPYPKVFVPIENLFGGNLMGKCADQGSPAKSLLFKSGDKQFRIGTPICYESVYGDYCAGYVRDGASLIVVITNDSWWGDTPGYRQHFSYSRLRAIETRKTVVRCANSGISAIIDPRGRILCSGPWWEPAILTGEATVNDYQTFFVRHGDIVGRLSVFAFVMLLAAAVFRSKKNGLPKQTVRKG